MNTLRLIIQPKLIEVIRRSFSRLLIAADPKLRVLQQILVHQAAKRSLQHWQKVCLNAKKSSVYDLMILQRFFSVLRKNAAAKRALAVKHNRMRVFYKVFFGMLRVMRNKRRVRKGLRKIAKLVAVNALKKPFEKLLYICHYMPREFQNEQLQFDQLHAKSRKLFDKASILFRMREDEDNFLIAKEHARHRRMIAEEGAAATAAHNQQDENNPLNAFRIASDLIQNLNDNPNRISGGVDTRKLLGDTTKARHLIAMGGGAVPLT